jgi:hypothetical protein
MGMVYNRFALGLLDGSITWSSATIKARLSRTSESLTDKDVVVMTALGLSATDLTLGTKTGPTEVQASDRVKYGCGNPTFTAVAAGAEVDKMIVFKFITNDADSIPGVVVGITPITPNGGDIVVTVDAAGLFYLQE